MTNKDLYLCSVSPGSSCICTSSGWLLQLQWCVLFKVSWRCLSETV